MNEELAEIYKKRFEPFSRSMRAFGEPRGLDFAYMLDDRWSLPGIELCWRSRFEREQSSCRRNGKTGVQGVAGGYRQARGALRYGRVVLGLDTGAR